MQLLILPDLALGLAHHAPKTYIAQDVGLIVFFVFAYVAGRTVNSEAGRASAAELVVVLLVLAAAQVLLGWDTTPIFTYVEAACAGGVAFALLRPNRPRLLLLSLALALLAHDAVAVKNGSGSTTGIELAAALAIVAYLVVRVRHRLPQWLVVAVACATLTGFLAFTADGADRARPVPRYGPVEPRAHLRSSSGAAGRSTARRCPSSSDAGSAEASTRRRRRGSSRSPSSTGDAISRTSRRCTSSPTSSCSSTACSDSPGWLQFVVGVAILGIRALESGDKTP